jgi:hypothetical protein
MKGMGSEIVSFVETLQLLMLTLELPSNDVVPLVEFQGQIAMRLDLAGEVGVHGGF